jgi:manganese/zinc/iron transport system substrate-binding protein
LRIVVTTGMIADLVRAVALPRAEVIPLLRPGIDPHGFRPTVRHTLHIQRADLVVCNGAHLEGALAEALEHWGRHNAGRLVTLADSLPPDSLIRVSEGSSLIDPHLWFDPVLWAALAPVVARNLARLDPAHAETYHTRARAYRTRLLALHDSIASAWQAVAPQRRRVVTPHDAFQYYARRYGVEFVALQGVNTLAEFGLYEVEQIAGYLHTHRLPVVFVESAVPPTVVFGVLERCRQKGWPVRVGPELFTDSPARPSHAADTHLGMLRYNTQALISGCMY